MLANLCVSTAVSPNLSPGASPASSQSNSLTVPTPPGEVQSPDVACPGSSRWVAAQSLPWAPGRPSCGLPSRDPLLAPSPGAWLGGLRGGGYACFQGFEHVEVGLAQGEDACKVVGASCDWGPLSREALERGDLRAYCKGLYLGCNVYFDCFPSRGCVQSHNGSSAREGVRCPGEQLALVRAAGQAQAQARQPRFRAQC